jgi:hypothetical protein
VRSNLSRFLVILQVQENSPPEMKIEMNRIDSFKHQTPCHTHTTRKKNFPSRLVTTARFMRRKMLKAAILTSEFEKRLAIKTKTGSNFRLVNSFPAVITSDALK